MTFAVSAAPSSAPEFIQTRCRLGRLSALVVKFSSFHCQYRSFQEQNIVKSKLIAAVWCLFLLPELESLDLRGRATQTTESIPNLMADTFGADWLQMLVRCIVVWRGGKRIERRRCLQTIDAFVISLQPLL